MRLSIHQAAERLLQSDVVAIPTETVWGLAARVSDFEAIQKVFSLKNRPPKNPLIVHLADPKDLWTYLLDPTISKLSDLIHAFWPGPLTLVLPVQEEKIPDVIRAGLPTAAFRVPGLSSTRELIQLSGPLVAPSANLSGKPSATCVEDVERDFGMSFPCFYPEEDISERNGRKQIFGVESTILIWSLQLQRWCLGRLGAISITEVENVIQSSLALPSLLQDRPLCPGQLFRHYAPETRLNLYISPLPITAEMIQSYDAVLGFSDRSYPNAQKIYSFGKITDIYEVLRNIYPILKKLDIDGIQTAFVDCSHLEEKRKREPLWEVFFDRLQKAASK